MPTVHSFPCHLLPPSNVPPVLSAVLAPSPAVSFSLPSNQSGNRSWKGRVAVGLPESRTQCAGPRGGHSVQDPAGRTQCAGPGEGHSVQDPGGGHRGAIGLSPPWARQESVSRPSPLTHHLCGGGVSGKVVHSRRC